MISSWQQKSINYNHFLLFFVIFLLCQGCSQYYLPDPSCPPPPSARHPTTLTYSCRQPTITPVIPNECHILSIADLVDVALQNSPTTRALWYQAKQAATLVGTARGAYLPSLNLQAFWLTEQLPQEDLIGGVFTFRENIAGFTLSTSYLLFDLGGRNGTLCSALAAMNQLCWQYNWEVQSVMIHVIQSYYLYANALGTVKAAEATVKDNLTTVEATAARKEAGAISVADELQARTNLLQAQILLEQDKGALNVAKATLIQSLGLPPDTPLCIADLPDRIEADAVCEDMALILQAAKEHRSDLIALRTNILENKWKILTAKSALFPTITTNLMYGKESIDNSRFLDSYNAQINLNIPLFSSFANINALKAAQAALFQAQAELDNQELIAFLAALSDYYELVANQQILKYSHDYLAVALENQKVAYANYRGGVTTIIDLMIANNALTIARRQLVDAKTNFLTSLANLAYDTGSITVGDLCLSEGTDYPPWGEWRKEDKKSNEDQETPSEDILDTHSNSRADDFGMSEK